MQHRRCVIRHSRNDAAIIMKYLNFSRSGLRDLFRLAGAERASKKQSLLALLIRRIWP